MTGTKTLRLGLIGSGFMGKTHVFGFATAMRVFDLPYDIVLASVADQNAELAEQARRSFGFEHGAGDWRQLIADDTLDIIDITAPNALHKEMAVAAIAAGKHVYCEKPLAPTAEDARKMCLAAEAAGVKTQVGFNYLANPMFLLARDMVRSGELGDIRSYRGIHAEDYMADSATPFGWRHDPAGGGVLADLGSHALATAEFIVGRISQVLGDLRTHITKRPGADNSLRDIEVDDVARAFLRFENGASGSIEANWIATGRKMQHDFEVHGSKGALIFSQERLNELQYYDTRSAAGRHGFRTIVAGPEHAPYGQFCVAPGHQLGFNDLKAIEVAGYINAIAGLAPEPFNFRSGLRVQELVESIQASARSGVWTGAPTVN